jgi:HSP20 family protein
MHELHGPGAPSVPINMFETPDELIVIAAMPGIEPEDLSVRIEKGHLLLSSDVRGEDAAQKYLCREWSYGPYRRSIELRTPVDGERANVTYGNGVLTIVLPKSQQQKDADLEVPKVGRARGAHVGRSAGGGS